MLIYAMDPDHPKLRPLKKAVEQAYTEGVKKEVERLEEENQ